MQNNAIEEPKKDLESELLTLSETADFLKLSEKSILRMISRQEIPVIRVGKQYRFLKAVLSDWLISKLQPASNPFNLNKSLKIDLVNINLSEVLFLQKDFIRSTAKTAEELLQNFCLQLSRAGILFNSKLFFDLLLQREALHSTIIRPGIALPHIRRPELYALSHPFIAYASIPQGLIWNAENKDLVNQVFLIGSPSEIIHLKILSRLSKLLSLPEFSNQLLQINDPEEISEYFLKKEKELL